jgi:hypothetical protein
VAAPTTRIDAVALIETYFPDIQTDEPFRFLSVEEVEVSSGEWVEIEAFAVSMRRCANGYWALTESKALGHQVTDDFHPKTEDYVEWLRSLALSLGSVPPPHAMLNEIQTDLQALVLAGISNSIDINITPTGSSGTFFLPSMRRNQSQHWGEARIPHTSMLANAFRLFGPTFFAEVEMV